MKNMPNLGHGHTHRWRFAAALSLAPKARRRGLFLSFHTNTRLNFGPPPSCTNTCSLKTQSPYFISTMTRAAPSPGVFWGGLEDDDDVTPSALTRKCEFLRFIYNMGQLLACCVTKSKIGQLSGCRWCMGIFDWLRCMEEFTGLDSEVLVGNISKFFSLRL